MLDRTAFNWIAEAEAQTDEALTLVQRMVEWFLATYEECSSENNGAYDATYDERVHSFDERCSARDGLDGYFNDELATFDDAKREEITDAAVDEIEGRSRINSLWTEKPSPANVPLLRAHDHYWGKGHVHRFEADIGKTTCGKKLENCPGDMDWGTEDDITCKACLRLIERQREQS
jgi:hypothetical protein